MALDTTTLIDGNDVTVDGVKFTFDATNNRLEAKNQVVTASTFAGAYFSNWDVTVVSSLADPPGGPTQGDCYRIIATATGAWTGRENKIACWSGTEWIYTTPLGAQFLYDLNAAKLYVYIGGTWVDWTNIASLSANVADGDYGDVVVSNTGSTWTIKNTNIAIAASQISDSTGVGRAILTAASTSAQRSAMGVPATTDVYTKTEADAAIQGDIDSSQFTVNSIVAGAIGVGIGDWAAGADLVLSVSATVLVKGSADDTGDDTQAGTTHTVNYGTWRMLGNIDATSLDATTTTGRKVLIQRVQ